VASARGVARRDERREPVLGGGGGGGGGGGRGSFEGPDGEGEQQGAVRSALSKRVNRSDERLHCSAGTIPCTYKLESRDHAALGWRMRGGDCILRAADTTVS